MNKRPCTWSKRDSCTSILFLGTLMFLLTILFPAAAQSPGGVSSNLRLWLKANAGTSTTTNNTGLSQWNDQSGNNRHATQGTAARQPAFKNNFTDNMNFNAVADFSAASTQHFVIPTSVLPNGTGGFSIYLVFRRRNTSAATIVGLGSSANNQSINAGIEGNGVAKFHTWNNAWNPGAAAMVTDAVTQASYTFSGGVRALSVNSVSHGTSAAAINLVAGGAYIGANHNNPAAVNLEGELAETVVYASNSTATEKLRIESYLALKYGITKSGNYESSSGTVLWNATANSAYHNNVAIIGRDDGSGLNQKQSRSSNAGFQLVMGSGSTISDLNSANAETFAANQSFMAIGSTTASTTFGTAFQEGNRMLRTWKVQKTGTIGTVKIGVLSTDVPGVTYLNLLVSNDATIDVADTRYQMTTETIGGRNYFTTTVTLTDGQFLSFMSSNLALPVELTHFSIRCEEQQAATIHWATAKEFGASHFVVEHSVNGLDWNTLNSIPATGTSTRGQQYWIRDEALTGALKYYRLVQYDSDGQYQVYPMARSTCHSTWLSPVLSSYPNPSSENLVLTYRAVSAAQRGTLRFIDHEGNTVFEEAVTLQTGDNRFDLSGYKLISGVYIVEILEGFAYRTTIKHVVR